MAVLDTRTILIEKRGGEEITIDIPASYKITYGPLTPGARDYDNKGNFLRIYEAKDKQRAVFDNVESFRDLSLPMKRRVVSIEEKKHRKGDSKGNKSEVSEVTLDDGEWEEA